ncbi:uncharacterized protein LOC122813737 [Protopterus annectens]|uniref:uncharacterized protein LOC122813737 n=1 Tax=Protopterus annectens TaxID=7888 RepID=UPI001CFB4E23|nr:uncharacterized protein LOC122813737 [Protopterus annectens]
MESDKYTVHQGLQMEGIPQRPLQVWICGHSYVHWSSKRAIEIGAQNLWQSESEIMVSWVGKRGLRWEGLLCLLSEKYVCSEEPDIVKLHLGGNDLTTCPLVDLKGEIMNILYKLLTWWPKMHIIWSDIIQRLDWKGARSIKAIEKIRRLHNSFMWGQMELCKGSVIHHTSIKARLPELYCYDSIHLSDSGLDLFICQLRDSVQFAKTKPHKCPLC